MNRMRYTREARETLTAIEMDCGDVLEFKLRDGSRRVIEVLQTEARILFTTLAPDERGCEIRGARTFYEFSCRLRIEGKEHILRREVPTQRSFYEPWVIDGIRIWLDAVDRIFEFLIETHGPCRPKKAVRLALQDANCRICPEKLHPWCPLPGGGLDITDCYCGEDCWLGPYFGASAHGGLDINHPPGTPIWAPIAMDDHYYFNSLKKGDENNRWRGHRFWPDGSEWRLQCHHMTRLTVPEHTPLLAGAQYAAGAGVHSGYHHHSHFAFMVVQENDAIWLDPWILFWQMYRDQGL